MRGRPPLQVLSLHSTSKGFFGECGHRGGWMHAMNCPEEILEQVMKLRSISLCPNTAGQVRCRCTCMHACTTCHVVPPGPFHALRTPGQPAGVCSSIALPVHIAYDVKAGMNVFQIEVGASGSG